MITVARCGEKEICTFYIRLVLTLLRAFRLDWNGFQEWGNAKGFWERPPGSKFDCERQYVIEVIYKLKRFREQERQKQLKEHWAQRGGGRVGADGRAAGRAAGAGGGVKASAGGGDGAGGANAKKDKKKKGKKGKKGRR